MSYLKELIEEIQEEAADFWEDVSEHLFKGKKLPATIEKTNALPLSTIRPAYLFADRVDSLIKILFGVSIIVSGIGAAFWGFSSISDLVKALVDSLLGRLVLVIVGLSYLITGIWKFFHLHK